MKHGVMMMLVKMNHELYVLANHQLGEDDLARKWFFFSLCQWRCGSSPFLPFPICDEVSLLPTLTASHRNNVKRNVELFSPRWSGSKVWADHTPIDLWANLCIKSKFRILVTIFSNKLIFRFAGGGRRASKPAWKGWQTRVWRQCLLSRLSRGWSEPACCRGQVHCR